MQEFSLKLLAMFVVVGLDLCLKFAFVCAGPAWLSADACCVALKHVVCVCATCVCVCCVNCTISDHLCLLCQFVCNMNCYHLYNKRPWLPHASETYSSTSNDMRFQFC